ncbi:HEPN domain-containing protein [Bacillus sp. SN1]|uniref:HEPN domain-containing protein n=1 Tax=Bacillus sp. SN1 TaxID=2055158 RepID=UPI000C22C7C1|nr:HEPN domain-containing protein [Bacillus sp. SN1]PJH92003.1 hypothetical protein CVV77_17070 [Bacillus sp. SN1]PSI03609.1 hypothetical protein C7H81_17795 [Bacillus subtilis]
MMNPLDSSLFLNSYSIPYNGFENNNLVLSMLYSKDTIILHYLVLKQKNKEKFMICGFDFISGSIIPVEIRNIGSVLRNLRDFLNSEYNTMNIVIESIDEIVEHFENKKIKKKIDTYKSLSILTSTQRNIISGSCEVYSNGKLIRPHKTLLISSRSGLLFGKFEFESNQDKVQGLKNIHLSEDWVIRYWIKDNSIESAGTIYEVKKGTDGITIFLSSFIHELSKKKLHFLSFQGSDPHSPVQAILRSSGMLKEQINIEGFGVKFVPYLVLLPIENLMLNNPEFGFGDVTFLTKNQAFDMYKGFGEKYNHNLLGQFDTFAQTIVESDNAYDAYLLGRQKVQDAIDMIILLSKNERVFNFYNLGNELNQWNRLRLYQNPKCSSLYYVENIVGLESILGDSNNTWENNSLGVDSQFENIFRELDWYEEKLYKKQTGQQSTLDKQLFNALKWLNRSWKAEDIEDKVIYTNIAMEFLVDKIETDPFLPDAIIREFKKLLKQLLKEQSDTFTEEYSNKIKDKSLGKLKDPPLKIKVRTLIRQLSIPITDEDFSKLWKVRDYRNDLVHGKDELKINTENVLIANILLGEFIVYRLRSMEEGD